MLFLFLFIDDRFQSVYLFLVARIHRTVCVLLWKKHDRFLVQPRQQQQLICEIMSFVQNLIRNRNIPFARLEPGATKVSLPLS